MKDLPVGVAQKKVLDAINVRAQTWQEAEATFSGIGIVVTSKRVGRSSEPVVKFQPTRRGGFNRDGEGEAWNVPSKLTAEQRQALAKFTE